jgi:hypothetical protein
MIELVLHPYYTFFFLYLEPISALVGAAAALVPSVYLSVLDRSSASESSAQTLQTTSRAVSTAITQLANLYLFFAVTETLVLRAARHHVPVWRALLIAMLIADFGHLLAAWRLGMRQYWCLSEWDWMELGGVGFVYAGAATRILFLSGVGVKLIERRSKKGL